MMNKVSFLLENLAVLLPPGTCVWKASQEHRLLVDAATPTGNPQDSGVLAGHSHTELWPCLPFGQAPNRDSPEVPTSPPNSLFFLFLLGLYYTEAFLCFSSLDKASQ